MILKVKNWFYDSDRPVLNAEDGRYTSEVLIRFSRGDIEEAKTRMEKAEPMMPLLSDNPNKVQDYFCPRCKAQVYPYPHYDYCPKCGQHLDFKDEESQRMAPKKSENK